MPDDERTQILQNAQILEDQMDLFDKMADSEPHNQFQAEGANFAALTQLDEYREFRNSMKKLVEKSAKFFRIQPDGTYPKASPADVAGLLSLYEKLNRNLKSLMDVTHDREKELGSSSAVTAFCGIAEVVQDYVRQDIHSLASLKASGSPELPQKIAKDRAGRLSVDSKNVNTVGDVLSTRIPVVYSDDKGAEHKGFFTEDKIRNYQPDLISAIHSAQNKAQRNRVFGNHQGMYKVAAEFMDIAMEIPELYNNPENLYNDVLREGALEKNLKDHFKGFVEKYGVKKYPQLEKLRSPETERRIEDYLKHEDPDTVTDQCTDYTDPMMRAADNLKVFAGHMPKENGDIDTHINKINGSSEAQRNSAMSAVANLLGVGKVIAYSENMRLYVNGTPKTGVFMENAVGEDLAKVNQNSRLYETLTKYEKEPEKALTGSAKKDIYSLQMLDYICNNVDRHIHNMLYQVDEEGRLSGVQGIDNDMSFGTEVPEADKKWIRGSHGISLNHLLYVPKDMADRIMALDSDVLVMALKGFKLSEEECNAAGKRLEQVKEAIGKKIKVLSDEELEKLDLQKAASEDRNKSGGYVDTQTERFSDFPGEIKIDLNEKKDEPRKIRNAKPIEYNPATYTPAAAEAVKTDRCDMAAVKVEGSINVFENTLQKMKESDSKVSFGSSAFQHLEQAIKKAITAAKKADNGLVNGVIRLPSMYEKEYKAELIEVRLKAAAYLKRKENADVDAMDEWEKVRLDSAKKMYDFAVKGIAAIHRLEGEDRALQDVNAGPDEEWVTKSLERIENEIPGVYLEKRPEERGVKNRVHRIVPNPKGCRALAAYVICSELRQNTEKYNRAGYDLRKFEQDVSHLSENEDLKSFMNLTVGKKPAPAELLQGYQLYLKNLKAVKNLESRIRSMTEKEQKKLYISLDSYQRNLKKGNFVDEVKSNLLTRCKRSLTNRNNRLLAGLNQTVNTKVVKTDPLIKFM